MQPPYLFRYIPCFYEGGTIRNFSHLTVCSNAYLNSWCARCVVLNITLFMESLAYLEWFCSWKSLEWREGMLCCTGWDERDWQRNLAAHRSQMWQLGYIITYKSSSTSSFNGNSWMSVKRGLFLFLLTLPRIKLLFWHFRTSLTSHVLLVFPFPLFLSFCFCVFHFHFFHF